MDLFNEMKIAGLLNKVAAQDPTAMPISHLLSLATQRAADCLELGDKVGSLAVGKRADIITVQRNQPYLQPWFDPPAGLVYATRGLDVREVWVDGQQRLANGQLLAGDATEASGGRRIGRLIMLIYIPPAINITTIKIEHY